MPAIIPQPLLKQQQLSWQNALSDMITDPLQLLSLLKLSPEEVAWQYDPHFPLRVTRSFVDRMNKGDPNDPLLKQVLTQPIESQKTKNYSFDPLQEAAVNPLPGLLHKFDSRVLLTFASNCAIHCRYCFRRHFPYEKNNPGRKGWGQTFEYIARHSNIVEVILSGGDPLLAQDKVLAQFLQQLNEISHVKIVRIHTRLPVVVPQRICSELLQIFKETRFKIVMVYHINHANEINSSIAEGVAQLKQQQITVLNQAVLLKGINDTSECLKSLSLKLFDAGILPYYVNLLDKVHGAGHFDVSLKTAKFLQQALREQLPGYLVPRFVQEVPQKRNKIPVDLLPEDLHF